MGGDIGKAGRGFLLRAFLASAILSLILIAARGQEQRATRMRSITPNQHAPHLYADRLALEVTLVNLPGAALPDSSWQLSYRLFFVAEHEFEQAARARGRGGDNLTPEKFPGRVALAEGEFTRKPLASLADRRVERAGIVFKSKIPDARRTSFASLLLFY